MQQPLYAAPGHLLSLPRRRPISIDCQRAKGLIPTDPDPHRIAASSGVGRLYTWSGDDYRLLRTIPTNPEGHAVYHLVVYEEPMDGRIRLVAA
jgi:hypothetical protein